MEKFLGEEKGGRPAKSRAAAIISLALVFIFMATASWFNASGGKVTIQDVYYPNANGDILHAQLLIPANASSATPAPGIVNLHGGSDYLQTVGNFSMELARHGYVVLSIDGNRSGSSYYKAKEVEGGIADRTNGATIALEQLMSYKFVDQEKIGLMGHSAGGTSIANAALAYPDRVKAIMPWGSGSFVALMLRSDPADFKFNVGYINASSDEFIIYATNLRYTRDFLKNEQLMAFFNTDQPVVAGKVYGSFENETARIIYTPDTTHIGTLINKDSIGAVLSFFDQAMPSGTNLSASDQAWPMKEAFTVLAFFALLAFAISIARVLLDSKVFRPLMIGTSGEPVRVGKASRVSGILLAIIVPMLTYYPVGLLLSSVKASKLFPTTWGNYLAWINLVNASILIAAFLVWHFVYGRKHGGNLASYRLATGSEKPAISWRLILRAALFAISVIFCIYLVVNLCYGMFKLDFRFWQFGIMPITLERIQFIWGYLISYLVVFAVMNIVTVSFVSAGANFSGKLGAVKQYALAWVIGACGLAILVLIYYIGLKTTQYPPFFFGYGTFPNGHPNTLSLSIKLTALVPTFTFASMLNTAVYRKTKNIYAATFAAALMVAMMVVSVNMFAY